MIVDRDYGTWGELRQMDARNALEEFADFDVALLGGTVVTTDSRLARAHGHRARVVAP